MSMPPYGGAPGAGYYPPPVDNTPYVPFAGAAAPVPGGVAPPMQPGFGAAPPYGAPGYAPPPGGAMPPGAYPGSVAPVPGAGYPPAVAPGYPAPAAAYPGAPVGGYPAPGYAPQPGPMPHYGSVGAVPPHMGGRVMYHIGVQAVGLKSRDGMFSKSDPYCVLFKNNGGRGGWSKVGRTETLKNNPSPAWSHKFLVDHAPGMQLKFEVWDEDRGADNIMETVEVGLDTVLHHPGMRYEAHLGRSSWTSSTGGMFTVTATRLDQNGQPMMHRPY